MSMMTIEQGPAPTIQTPDAHGLRLRKAGQLVWRRIEPTLRIIVKALMEHRIRRAALELSGLDDRMLKDIGLSRWGLEDAVRSNRANDLVPFGPEWAWLNALCAGDCAGCSRGHSSQR